MRRRISRAQQTKNWCVGFSFPPPAYAGIHPTLHLFGFQANALNSHSPPYLPGFDPGSGLERFGGPPRGPCFGGLRGPPLPGHWVWSPYPCLADPEILAFPGHLRRPGQWLPERPAADPPRPRSLGLGFLNNLVNHRKGERSPRRGSCPST